MHNKPIKLALLVISGYFGFILMKKLLTDKSEEIDILARTIWGEARGEGTTGMQAVANVITNRVKANIWYGASYKEVCLKPYQFSCWNESDPNRAKILSVNDSDQIFKNALYIAEKAVNGTLPDITLGANHYHRYNVSPSWADINKITVGIGNHIFYKL